MRRFEFDVSIFVINPQGDVIAIDEFDGDNDICEFVMITNDYLNPDYNEDNTIFIYYNWKESLLEAQMELNGKFNIDYYQSSPQCCRWSIENGLIPNVRYLNESTEDIQEIGNNSFMDIGLKMKRFLNERYLNGYGQCQDIMLNAKPLADNFGCPLEEYIPVIMTAYHTKADFRGKSYNGYLPSIGQLHYIFTVLEEERQETWWKSIFNILTLKYSRMWFFWWSSTIYDNNYVWIFKNNDLSIEKRTVSNTMELPLFALKLN